MSLKRWLLRASRPALGGAVYLLRFSSLPASVTGFGCLHQSGGLQTSCNILPGRPQFFGGLPLSIFICLNCTCTQSQVILQGHSTEVAIKSSCAVIQSTGSSPIAVLTSRGRAPLKPFFSKVWPANHEAARPRPLNLSDQKDC